MSVLLLDRCMIRREEYKKRLTLNYVQYIQSLCTVRGMACKLLSVVFHYQVNFSLFFFKNTCFCILGNGGMSFNYLYTKKTVPVLWGGSLQI